MCGYKSQFFYATQARVCVDIKNMLCGVLVALCLVLTVFVVLGGLFQDKLVAMPDHLQYSVQ